MNFAISPGVDNAMLPSDLQQVEDVDLGEWVRLSTRDYVIHRVLQ